MLRYCQECGAELPPEPKETPGDRPAPRRCRRCGASATQRPTVGCAGIITRDTPKGVQVLLVRRGVLARVGPGCWSLPCGYVEWGEDVRDGVRRELAEECGLQVEVLDAVEVLSNFHDPTRLSVGCWFRCRPRDQAAEPRPGDDVDRAEFFPLDALPSDLAFDNDRRVLDRLARDAKAPPAAVTRVPELESLLAESDVRLERRRTRYRDLLELYTSELMRGAWLNDLLLRLSKAEGTAQIAGEASTHLASQREAQLVRVWIPGPPDLCERCPWRDRCPRERCLHLVAAHGQGTGTPREGKEASQPTPEETRVPLLREVPAGECATKGTSVRAEIDVQGALPLWFEGFPLDMGQPVNGVIGVIAKLPLDTNVRRLCEIVARHLAALLKNARLVADLRAASKAKSAFIARMSHELKTPLTAILGFAELLREERAAAGDEMGADGASTIEQSGRQLLQMVESILEIAKLESGAIAFSPSRLELATLVRSAYARWKPRADEKGILLALGTLPAANDSVVWADSEKVERVLDELLSNAVKFTKEGRVDINIRALADHVECEVKDTGIGISKVSIDRIFEPFGQADESVHIEYGGLGIGLAVARTLVSLHGGRIGVETASGAGSRFTFALPKRARLGGEAGRAS